MQLADASNTRFSRLNTRTINKKLKFSGKNFSGTGGKPRIQAAGIAGRTFIRSGYADHHQEA